MFGDKVNILLNMINCSKKKKNTQTPNTKKTDTKKAKHSSSLQQQNQTTCQTTNTPYFICTYFRQTQEN